VRSEWGKATDVNMEGEGPVSGLFSPQKELENYRGEEIVWKRIVKNTKTAEPIKGKRAKRGTRMRPRLGSALRRPESKGSEPDKDRCGFPLQEEERAPTPSGGNSGPSPLVGVITRAEPETVNSEHKPEGDRRETGDEKVRRSRTFGRLEKRRMTGEKKYTKKVGGHYICLL